MKTNVKKSNTKKSPSPQPREQSKDKKGKKTKEERSRNIESGEGKKRVKEERSRNQEKRGGVSREERSRNQEETKNNENKKVVKAKKSKSVSKVDPAQKAALMNKKKFCKKFFVEELDGKNLMRDFVGLRGTSNCLAEAMKPHWNKCRYFDIMCPDATRVILKERPPDNDFIHANWMTMPDKFQYISAQGPMEETLEDFWHMTYTEKSPAIVMICDWLEDGVQKCAHYVPKEDEKFQQFGIYKVTRVDTVVEVFEDVAMQTFEVSIPSRPDSPLHTVKHYHYRNWRDHTAPMTSTSVLKLLKALRESVNKGPPIIHCSAGIGRTATFIGVDYGNQRIGQVGEKLDILDLVREMRQMRDKAVQSHHQFIFMLVCITDLMVSEGVKRNEDMTDLCDFYREFMTMLKKKREEEDKKKAEVAAVAEKAKKEQEEKDRKEKGEKEKIGEEKTQSSTCSTTQEGI
ncbi:unnamed protein product [Caenorhabditis brenneri]